jgi:hypothetical protein
MSGREWFRIRRLMEQLFRVEARLSALERAMKPEAER